MSCEYGIYRGQRILFCNHAGLRGAALLENVTFAAQMTLADHSGHLLLLTDFSNASVNDAVMEFFQSDRSKQAAQKPKKQAVVGITGMKKLFLHIYHTATGGKARPYDDLEAAKQYLIS